MRKKKREIETPTDRSRAAEVLATASLFSTFDQKELDFLAVKSELVSFEAGQTIFEAGDPGDRLFIVASGSVVILSPDDGSVLAEFVAADSFGELELLTGAERNASSRAEAAATLLAFPAGGAGLRAALSERPELAARILRSFLLVIVGRTRKSNALVKENSPWVRELRRQVYGDKLTGLLNKAYLEENLPKMLSSPQGPAPLALLMMKPDNFKEINDRFGHEVGDSTLVLVARELENAVGKEGIAVRYMGNELGGCLSGPGQVRGNRGRPRAPGPTLGRRCRQAHRRERPASQHQPGDRALARARLRSRSADQGRCGAPADGASPRRLADSLTGGRPVSDANCRDAPGAELGDIDIFSGLPEADLGALAAKMRECEYLPGQAVFRENEAGHELFVVSSGLVAISVASQDGEDIELSRVGRGAFFGEMAILERAPRSATCTAVEKTACLVLEAADFEALLVEVPQRRRRRAGADARDRRRPAAQDRLLPVADGPVGRRRPQASHHRFPDGALQPALSRRLLRGHLRPREARGRRAFLRDVRPRPVGKMNAAYGAEFCDRVILEAAAAFREVFDEEDILVRYGGDDFASSFPPPPPRRWRSARASAPRCARSPSPSIRSSP